MTSASTARADILTEVSYTEAVRSVADQLRPQTVSRVRDMPLAERIALALALGDQDLDLFVRSSGLNRADALKRLTAQRAQGRRGSGLAAAVRR